MRWEESTVAKWRNAGLGPFDGVTKQVGEQNLSFRLMEEPFGKPAMMV
jgi:hypothetical protein